MANHIIINKLTNGKVEVVNSLTNTRSLQPDLDVIKSQDGETVIVLRYDSQVIYDFNFNDVEKVVRVDTTEITITDQNTLYTELRDNFFFSLAGGGSGGTGWADEVNTFADLPAAADHTGEVYLVKTKTGSQLTFNLKRSGFYQSDGVSWTKLSTVQFMFTDDELTFKDDVDNTKQLGFELSSISTGTRRTATFPDKNGTVAYLDDVVGDRLISFAQDSTQTVTFSTTGTVYLNLAANSLDNSATYKISGFYIWGHGETNTDFFMEVRNFGVLLPPARHQQEPKDHGADQRHYTSFAWTVTPTAGSISIDLNFGTTDSADSSTLYGAYLQLDKIT